MKAMLKKLAVLGASAVTSASAFAAPPDVSGVVTEIGGTAAPIAAIAQLGKLAAVGSEASVARDAGRSEARSGRTRAISGSRPTMIVSLWCRAWLQRQTTDSRNTMNEAISYMALFIQSVLKAVPWLDSCQRESDVEA